MSETRRLPPHGRGAVLTTSEHVIVRAMCMHHACYRGRGKGHERQREKPRSELNPPQGEHEGNHGKRGGPKQGGKGAAPPPPRTSAAPRARIVPATCTPRRKGQQTRQQQPAYMVVTGWWWNVLAVCVQHACHHRRGRRARRARKGATRLTPTPPHRARKRGTEASRAAKKGRASKKRAPPPADKCRASCLHCARSVHAPEERQQERPPSLPHPLMKGTRAARGSKGEAREMGGGHRGDDKAGEKDGRQAVGYKAA